MTGTKRSQDESTDTKASVDAAAVATRAGEDSGAATPINSGGEKGWQDVEKAAGEAKQPLDIEHTEVEDDPRLWSWTKKHLVLAVISITAMNGAMTVNCVTPALDPLQRELNANDQLLAATISIFILFQGLCPPVWASFGDIFGRKKLYLLSLLLYCAATAVCSEANSITLLIIMRIFQSVGSSAVLSLGAGTLSDIFETHERGTKVGIFYAMPMLGPSIAPIIGGGLAELPGSWRNTFRFLLAYGGVCFAMLIFLPETFRRQRSLPYRQAVARATAERKAKRARAQHPLPSKTDAPPERPGFTRTISRIVTGRSAKTGERPVRVKFRDVNPFAAVASVLRQPHNVISIAFSGILFAVTYALTFTVSRSFAAPPWNYSTLKVGCIVLAFGGGQILGSLIGGRLSDYVLARMKARNNGVGVPEMRISSTFGAMFFVPSAVLAYGWTVQKEVPLYGPIITLFVAGFSLLTIYSSILAYTVDSNAGRSMSAVACNSLIRGISAAVASQVAEPVIDAIGNGWFYTIFAFVLAGGEVALSLLTRYGQRWRESAQQREEDREQRRNKKRETKR